MLTKIMQKQQNCQLEISLKKKIKKNFSVKN